MRLPYDLQQLYIKMLSNHLKDRAITQEDGNIKLTYQAPDGEYVTHFNTCYGEVSLNFNGLSNWKEVGSA